MREIRLSFPGSVANLHGVIRLPASKSISNRVLITEALCNEKFRIDNLSDASDTQVLQRALKNIRDGTANRTIDVQDAGTTFRFLTAYLACQPLKEFILKGSERIHQRPIADLVNALREIGADITYLEHENFAPLLIKGKKLEGGGVVINGDVSSQFVSALCLIVPALEQGLVLEMQREAVSFSYIEMTLQLMAGFGIQYTLHDRKIIIPHQQYAANDFIVENDWSSATFFYAMAMLVDSASIQFELLKKNSVQGDSYIREFAGDFGIQTIFEKDKTIIKKSDTIFNKAAKTYDLNSYPDMAIPLIVACAIKYPYVTFTGLKHLQYKESDRISALTTELKKVNIMLNYENDILSFDHSGYKASNDTIRFNTYKDHRIAMALSMLALEGFTIVLDDGDCVQKSFPGYFWELRKIGFEVNYLP